MKIHTPTPPTRSEDVPPCPACRGAGRLTAGGFTDVCPKCAGTGLTDHDANLPALRRLMGRKSSDEIR